MAGSSFKEGPFLTYLTVFQSRLGATNVVLSTTGHAFIPTVALERQLKRLLESKTEVDLRQPANLPLLDYLTEKKLLGSRRNARSRYGDWTLTQTPAGPIVSYRDEVRPTLNTYWADVHLSDRRVRSTVGVPTADNVAEIVGLVHQLRLITRSKNTWTAAGHTAAALRSYSEVRVPLDANPFILGAESIALLRQLVAQDWLLLSELLDVISRCGQNFYRDEIATQLPDCALRAYKRAKELGMSPSALSEAKAFAELLRVTVEKKKKQEDASGGPGVLEHRTAPRLEWLVDLGALSKEGLPANGFQYRQTADLQLLRELGDAHALSAFGPEEVSLRYWKLSEYMRPLRTGIQGVLHDSPALTDAFRRVRRTVGPAPIREVAFVALVCNPDAMPGMEAAAQQMIDWAAADKRVTLSGGRFTRQPEFIHLSDSICEEKGESDR